VASGDARRDCREAGRDGGAVQHAAHLHLTFRDGGAYAYGRWGNPTWSALEEALGLLEGGRALVFGSGQAALAAVLETLPVGATVLLPSTAYLGTRGLLADLATRQRLRPRAVDVTDTTAVLAAVPGAHMLWVESPTNPLLGIADLGTLLSAARQQGIPSVVDNTFARPLLQQPLQMGATAVVHSATKYIGGHSDLLCGAVVTRDEGLRSDLHARRTLHGGVAGTMEAWLALRGLRTLSLRLDRAQQNARILAERLAAHTEVTTTHYPGLPIHPGHDLAARQMAGPGAMISFELDGAAAADALVGRLRLVVGGTSLGGVESTIDSRDRARRGHLARPRPGLSPG